MKIESSTFDQLPFTKLFRDYVTGDKNISQFFDYKLPDENTLQQEAEEFRFTGDRPQSVTLLKEFNKQFDAGAITLGEIEKLRNPESLVIVTGQQVSLFGGPLYTIYKTITTIRYARRLQKITGRPVVPVFWLADEDHDIEEVSTIIFPGDSEATITTYQHKNYTESPPPAASIQLDEAFENFKSEISECLDDTDFTDQLWTEIDKCYHKKKTFAEGFGKWLLKLFGQEGLILAGSNYPEIKNYTKSIFQTAVVEQKLINETLDNTTYRLLEEGYHGQVQVQPSNLFYLDEQNQRLKIQFVDKSWSIPGKKWNNEELIKDIDEYPQNFSPNVFLRPILQDALLPVAGIVAGPGEIAYYAQMKDYYHIFDKTMPVIIPRFSITLIESAIDRIIEKLPFTWTDYQKRIEDLEKLYVDENENVDIEKMFGIWKSQIEELSRAKKEDIQTIDPTLEGSVGKAKAVYFSELDKLKSKVYRTIKEEEKIQLDRILRIKQNLFPNGNIQEREVAFIYYMNKYGMRIWDKLMEALEHEEPFTHKRIYL